MKKKNFTLKLLFLLSLVFTSHLMFGQSMTFSEHDKTSMPAEWKQHAAFGDYDNDGDLDLLVTSAGDTTVLLQNSGSPSFSFARVDSFLQIRHGSAHFVDFNNDNNLDILLTGITGTGKVTKLFENSGAPLYEFTELTNQTLPGVAIDHNNQPRGQSSNMADFDNDGDLDIIIAGVSDTGDEIADLFWNEGNGNFVHAVNPVNDTGNFVGMNGAGIYITDYNKDGFLDILMNGSVSGGVTATVILYKNTDGGTFTPITTPFENGSRAMGGCTFDVDQDGDIDFALPGYEDASPGWINWYYRNDGNDNFTEDLSVISMFTSGGSYLPADFNNDGNMDYIVNGYSLDFDDRRLGLFLNDGNGTFTMGENLLDGTSVLFGGNGGSLSIADFDNDGDVDYYTNGWSGGANVGLYKNNISTGLTIPNQPVNPSVSESGDITTLSWDTLSAYNHTYNVYLKSRFGDSLIVSPMADVSSGYRKIAAYGNSFNNKLLVKSLNDTAEYIWGVQTIDQRYIGSEFTQANIFALKVREIKVSGFGNTATVAENGTLQMEAMVSSEYALDKSVSWSISSDDADTASISVEGLLTALKVGMVTVRATANDGSEVYGEFEVSISSDITLVTAVTVTGEGGATSITTDNGTLQMKSEITPADATDKTVTWSISSNDADTATISTDGLLTALQNGTVTVKATANDGSGVYGELDLTISGQITLVSAVTVTGEGGVTAISTDDGTLQMESEITPADATDKSVTWSISSNDADTATISTDGLLTALQNGTVTVRATANDGSEVYGETDITISNQTSSFDGKSEDLVIVYPNPSNNGFVVDLYKSNTSGLITIFNITGTQIYQYEATPNERVKLEPSIFKNTGIYIMSVLQDGQTNNSKLVVE